MLSLSFTKQIKIAAVIFLHKVTLNLNDFAIISRIDTMLIRISYQSQMLEKMSLVSPAAILREEPELYKTEIGQW